MTDTDDQQRATQTNLDRKRAESDALFLSIGEGAIATDEHGRIARVNQAALDILGFKKAAELIGKWYPDVMIAEDEAGQPMQPMERPLTRALLTGKSISTRLTYIRKDKRKIIVYLTVSVVMLENEPIGAIQVFRDVTQEVELEQAKDEFISLASHQLRTPATAVKQYAGMLIQGYAGELTPTQQLMAESIYESNERQIAIVNDLLRVAQVDAGKVQLRLAVTDLVATTERVIEDLEPKFTVKNQRLSFARPKASITPLIDKTLIRMVIENIIDNASKYTPADKSVTISLRSNQHFAIIDIKDQGVGIKKEDLPLLFQKFSRLPNSLSEEVGGTGLGLYWAKKIVDLHGGSIVVHSQPDKGTTFSIRIPLAHDEQAQKTLL
jgi:PAS domain S-box-containing protein